MFGFSGAGFRTRMSTQLLYLFVLACVLAAARGDGDAEEVSSSNQVESDDRDGRVGPAGVLAEIAKEMVTRSATNSQVLSLNLTNLLILLILKALLFGAGLFSFGFLKNGGPGGRSADTEPLFSDPRVSPPFTESELLLALSFLMGDPTQEYDCLYRVACEEPSKAKEYLLGAKMMIKGAKLFNSVIPYDTKYEPIVATLQKAVEHGASGGNCLQRYSCDSASRNKQVPKQQ
uniref:(California timema) hypothetical protein n=1 Tax=Timema californicum TaxID=61474 RepID=A0A7R9J8P6_TIMCA|nr:unnamed protein product [Timema californicum]